MKRLLSVLLLLSLLLAAMPVQADSAHIGNMEVVNCNEWVSLRERPATSAKRLVKVSLGVIVSNCRQVSDAWIYAEYDGYAGYILSQYLEPSDGRLTFSAMLITITGDGAPFYATLDSTEAHEYIPTNTVVRDARMMDNGRICVMWGDRTGFIRSEHAEVYEEMIHHPREMLLHCNLFSPAEDLAAPDIRLTYTADFPLKDYAYSQYVQEDEAEPKAAFVVHADRPISNVHLFSVSLRDMDADTGAAVFDATLEHVQPTVDPQHPLSVVAAIHGTTPNLAIGYEDAQGVYRFAFVGISGKDGSLILRAF